MLLEEQIAARQERGRTTPPKILRKPNGQAYGDYEVLSGSGRKYRVALRGPGLFDNYCACPDFARNTLGTCKHIEGLLDLLRRRYGGRFERQRFRRTRASLSLHYGDTLAVRLRLPADPTPELRAIATEYFDPEGFLRKEHYGRFGQVLDKLRGVDDTAVVYSDVPEFIDRENELAEGLETESRMTRATGERPASARQFAEGAAVPVSDARRLVRRLSRARGAGR
jgi:hypothetical protein